MRVVDDAGEARLAEGLPRRGKAGVFGAERAGKIASGWMHSMFVKVRGWLKDPLSDSVVEVYRRYD